MKDAALDLLKARIGISSKVRDPYLKQIINSVIKELEDTHKITLEEENSHHLMFVVDWSDWRYNNRYEQDKIPRHLQFRLNNLIINNVRQKK